MLKQRKFRNTEYTVADCIRRLILSWLIAVLITYIGLPRELRCLSDLDGLGQLSFGRILVMTCGFTVFLYTTAAFSKTEAVERWSIATVVLILALVALQASVAITFLVACTLILVIVIAFAIFGWNPSRKPVIQSQKASHGSILITVGLSVGFFLFVSLWTVGRVYSFYTPTYDFGIFSQMFYNMKESGLPITTVERDGALSHFAVHVSPIYYLLLPFYYLLPKPATLQILQAAVMTTAVIPLWKIAGHYGLTGWQRMLVCAALLLYPAYSGGANYDIHENCFLTPLIFWLFYGIDKKNTAITVIAAVLTLTVKEDAPMYIAVAALWMITKSALRYKKADRKDLITGISLFIVAVLWFFCVTKYLSNRGDGVMSGRYKNFMYDGSSSLMTVIKSVVLCPMKTIYECADPEKTTFILQTILPLICIPLLTRRFERYLLLIPYILVNLMSDYQYQHNLFFQYTFGSNAFLFYLTVVNLADFKGVRKKTFLLICITVTCTVCFSIIVVPKAVDPPVQAIRNFDYYETIRSALNRIPEDAGVAATTYHTTFLSQREELYDVNYCSKEHLLDCDYVVLSLSPGIDYKRYATENHDKGFDNLIKLLEANGFHQHLSLNDILVIYRKDH